eukprot:TRINITY_DN11593_c1_g1_i1.p1 TRINITY_DN11593_c1_g1~~TRINITY_DN11593_c1_g1_i1.p1  ORF type:complete len:384 (-),score=68.75 TRINITY_DN11593_c1_g1_i1:58-1209(-)
MSARVISTGQLAEVMFYDPTDPDLTFKLKLPDGSVNWYPKKDCELLDDVQMGAQAGEPGDQNIRVGPRPVEPPRPPRPPSPPRVYPTWTPPRLQQPHREPLLGTARRRGDAGDMVKGAYYCFSICVSLVIAILAFHVALGRNAHCDPADLMGVSPPYDGEILPANFTLVERRQYFQLTKLVDVYDTETGAHVGYFYDMNFLLFFRFGYSDASDRIWFEAKYPSFFARIFQAGDWYFLQRCDVGAGGRSGGIFDVKEDWAARPWYCYNNCYRAFNVSRRIADDTQCSGGSCYHPVANVVFNSTLEWFQNGIFSSARHRWYMNLTNPDDDSEIAFAQQRFKMQHMGLGSVAVSRWSVDVEKEEPYLPNWVVGFMAALDDIEEGAD